MLRGLVLLLIVANLAFYAWSQGWLDSVVGVRAGGEREPERLARQVRPETVVILPPSSADGPPATPAAPALPSNPASALPAASFAPSGGLACLEAGPFSAAQFAAAEAAIQSALPNLPNGSWANLKTDRPGLWMVYMGKYSDREALNKMQEELRRIKIDYDEVRSPPELDMGLSLGRFEERKNAYNALEQFAQRGIRSARVVEVRAPSSQHMLRVDKADVALAAQVLALKSNALGKGFGPCVKAAGI
jgi:hypothetical protein